MSIESLSRSLVKRLLGRRDVVKGASPILPTKPPSRGLRRAIQSALWPNTLGRVPVGGVGVLSVLEVVGNRLAAATARSLAAASRLSTTRPSRFRFRVGC